MKQRRAGGKKYWYVDMFGEVSTTMDLGDIFDDHQFKSGNYFPNREGAVEELERLYPVVREGVASTG